MLIINRHLKTGLRVAALVTVAVLGFLLFAANADPILGPGLRSTALTRLGASGAAGRLVVTTAERMEVLYMLDLLGPRRLHMTRQLGEGVVPPFGSPDDPEVETYCHKCDCSPGELCLSTVGLLEPPLLLRWGFDYADSCPVEPLRSFYRRYREQFLSRRREQAYEGELLRQLLLDRQVILWCESFFGAKKDAYIIVYSSILPAQASGQSLVECPWPLGGAAVILVGGLEQRSSAYDDYVASLVVHEIAHSFYRSKEVPDLHRILWALPRDGRKFLDGIPAYAFDESLAEAVALCFLDGVWSQRRVEEHLRLVTERGGSFISALYTSLLEYERNRDRYPTLDDFSEEITAAVIERAGAMGLWPPRPAGGS